MNRAYETSAQPLLGRTALSNERNPDSVAARQSQVEEWLDRARRSVESLGTISLDLVSRLSAVMRQPDKLDGANGPCPPETLLVPVADQLRGIVRDAQGTAARLSDLMDRLEV